MADAAREPDPVQLVATGYDGLAERWHEFTATVTPSLYDGWLSWLEARLEPGAVVVELGCGTGQPVAERLSSRYRYVGVDVSSRMLARAAVAAPAGRLVLGDMRTIEFASGSVDAVVALYSIIHLPRSHHRALFGRVARWLRPGGSLVASFTGDDLPAGREDDWLGGGPMFWSGHDPKVTTQLLEASGFTVHDAEVIPQLEGDSEVSFLWVAASKA